MHSSPTQLALPIEVRPEEIAREKTLGGAIELCAKVRGFTYDKQLTDELDCDKSQLSRWQSGSEGIIWPKLEKLMDVCCNDAPLLWMLHQRGYDLNSLRKRESETEKALRIEREARIKAEDENRILREVIQGRARA